MKLKIERLLISFQVWMISSILSLGSDWHWDLDMVERLGSVKGLELWLLVAHARLVNEEKSGQNKLQPLTDVEELMTIG